MPRQKVKTYEYDRETRQAYRTWLKISRGFDGPKDKVPFMWGLCYASIALDKNRRGDIYSWQFEAEKAAGAKTLAWWCQLSPGVLNNHKTNRGLRATVAAFIAEMIRTGDA